MGGHAYPATLEQFCISGVHVTESMQFSCPEISGHQLRAVLCLREFRDAPYGPVVRLTRKDTTLAERARSLITAVDFA
jgi:hypothetical protein